MRSIPGWPLCWLVSGWSRGPSRRNHIGEPAVRTPGRRSNGWLLLPALVLALVSGCATGQGKSTYQVRIPLLNAEPQCFNKALGKIVDCEERKDLALVVLYDDWAQIIRALKAACL